MPDEPRNPMEDGEQENSPRPERKKGKKKKGRKWTLLFFFLLLAAGVAAGLHVGGVWDARPLLYASIPKLPWIGKGLASSMGIPEKYSFTVEQRRRLELQQWNDRLNEKESELKALEEKLSVISAGIEVRSSAVERKEAELAVKETKPPENPKEEKAYVDMLMKTYSEISPRRAALILEQLREDLAVKLLEAMPQDVRASILSRMEAVSAARLTERLAAGRPQ